MSAKAPRLHINRGTPGMLPETGTARRRVRNAGCIAWHLSSVTEMDLGCSPVNPNVLYIMQAA